MEIQNIADLLRQGKRFRTEEVQQIRENIPIENLLDRLANEHDFLLHGSRIDIAANYLQGERGVFATTYGRIAILKAIFSNRNCNLEYPMDIIEGEPFNLIMDGINSKTIGHEGFVYFIPSRIGFRPGGGNIEYVSPFHKVSFSGSMPVRLNDFEYQYFERKNGNLLLLSD